ncbi:DUF5655 domain-containing protein [Pedobacter sp. PWIIR3]
MEKNVQDFINLKSPQAIALLEHLALEFNKIGASNLHSTKTMLVFSNRINFAYIIQMGKDFIDLVLPFDKPYYENLCFRKIKQVPNAKQYNHHIRIYHEDDINDEVKEYMKLAYLKGV